MMLAPGWQRLVVYCGLTRVKETADQIKACCGFPTSEGTERVYVEVKAATEREARDKLAAAIKYKWGKDHWLLRELAKI